MKIFISVDMEGMAGITSPSRNGKRQFLSAGRSITRSAGSLKESRPLKKMERLRRSPLPIPMEAEETFPMMN